MSLLVLGLLVFLGIHSVSIAAPHWRERMVLRLGAAPWRIAYSMLSLVGLALIIRGFGLARAMPIVLYSPPAALHTLSRVLMVPVFPLLLAAYLPGRIQSAARHPMLVAIKLWAAAHLLANGSAADVLLFGGFLAWAVIDRISLKHRPARANAATPGAPPGRWNDLIAVVVGLALYALTIGWAHLRLLGVSPLA